MLLWIMVFVGTLLFILGLYSLVKGYKAGRYIKRYGYLSYIGFSIALLGIILLMEPVFINLPKLLPLAITMYTCIVLSQLLLKPTFLKNKE